VAAFSLIELVFALGLAATVGAIALPAMLTSLDDARALGAARMVSSGLQKARMEAIARNASTAMRMTHDADGYRFTFYVDGNRNGLLTEDISAGIDRPTSSEARLGDQFSGVDFGTRPDLPPVDPGSAPPGSDPIRLGSSDMAVFTPLGTATSGSLYILGRRGMQYVVRIFGDTGKTRTLKFNVRSRQWSMLAGG
jgi:type II secretory pathway pseudopilin PulG